MTLRTLLHGSTLLLAAAGLAATVSLAVFTNSLENAAAQMARAVESLNASERLSSHLLLLNSERYFAVLTGGELRPAGEWAMAQIDESLRDIGLHIGGDEERRLVERVHEHIGEFEAHWREATRAELPPVDLYLTLASVLERAYASLEELIELNLRQARTEQQAIAERSRFANALALATAGLLFAVVLAFFIGLRALVYQPLAALVTRIRHFRAVDQQAIHPRWPEEIREIARSFDEMTAALKAQEQKRLQFLAGVAHDLRTPLGAMSLAAELLANPALPEAERAVRVATFKRQLRHLAQMLQDLLDTTQIEAGKLSIAPAAVDLCALLHEAVDLFRSTGEADRVTVLAPPGPCIASCDRTRMMQVLNNLLSNALKYSPRGGAITATLRERGEWIELAVADQGIGIEPAEQETIFEPYRRSSGTRDAFPGVGLGLSVSRRIVHAHGGAITVESRAGRGATFTVRIPRGGPAP